MRISTFAMAALLSLFASGCTAETKTSVAVSPGKSDSGDAKAAQGDKAPDPKPDPKGSGKAAAPLLIYFTMPG